MRATCWVGLVVFGKFRWLKYSTLFPQITPLGELYCDQFAPCLPRGFIHLSFIGGHGFRALNIELFDRKGEGFEVCLGFVGLSLQILRFLLIDP